MENQVHDTIHVNVEYSTEDEEYGPVWVATNEILHFVTDGQTFKELLHNIHEVIELCLEDTDTIAEFNLVPNPRIVIHMELPENYAEIA